MKILTTLIFLYFLILFPTTHFASSGNKFLYACWKYIIFASGLVSILALKYKTIQQLGLGKNGMGKAILIGGLLGVTPITIVVLSDILLIETGLAQAELFTGVELRNPEEMGFKNSLTEIFFNTLIVPFLDQVFITGLILNNHINKENSGSFIFIGGLLHSLFQFKLSVGNLFLGMISAGLLKLTGSIIVPFLLHSGFAIAETLIVFNFPRLISFLVFFV